MVRAGGAVRTSVGVGLRTICIAVYFMSAITSASAAEAEEKAEKAARPSFTEITMAVDFYFTSSADYRPGDLVTQSTVQGALEAVRAVGWEIPEAERIVGLAHGDGSFLASQLGSLEGRKFMRKIARHPGAYSRLDRLSSISGGQKLIRDLVDQRDGDKFIQYLATTQSGHNLGRMMGRAKNGADLNKPTGRIYTADDLLAELQRVYANAN